MAQAKYSLYKYVKVDGGWRYCKAAFHPNKKIKPDIVIVKGAEEKHTEGKYYLNFAGQWIDVGADALEAQRKRSLRLAQLECERLGGRPQLVAEEEEEEVETLQAAIDDHLAEIELAISSGNKQRGTYKLIRCTLEKFQSFSKLSHLHQITPRILDEYAAHCLETSPTHSRATARSEYIRMLQFLKARGVALTLKNGEKLSIKHGPKKTKGIDVSVNTAEEIEKFLNACRNHKQRTFFLLLQRSGLRLAEAMTLRWQDIVLDADDPRLAVCERRVGGFEFIPKWYAAREVSIDPVLVAELRKLRLASGGGQAELAFGKKKGKVNRHFHRECKSVARRAGLNPDDFHPHRFRANYITGLIRGGLDLEMRAQVGHRDTESLRHYVKALEGEQRSIEVTHALKVSEEKARVLKKASGM
jgi:integrase